MANEPGDWDPLPEQDVMAYPGELATAAKTVALRPQASIAAGGLAAGPASGLVLRRRAQPTSRLAATAAPAPVARPQRPPAPRDEQRERAAAAAAQLRHERLERFWVAYVVFFFAGLPLLMTDGLSPFLNMALAGCITGLAWQFVPAERIAAVTSAVVVYAGVMIVPHLGSLLVAPMAAGTTLFSGCLVGYLASLGGASGEDAAAIPPADGPPSASA